MTRWVSVSADTNVVRISQESPDFQILKHMQKQALYWANKNQFRIARWYTRHFRYYYEQITQ